MFQLCSFHLFRLFSFSFLCLHVVTLQPRRHFLRKVATSDQNRDADVEKWLQSTVNCQKNLQIKVASDSFYSFFKGAESQPSSSMMRRRLDFCVHVTNTHFLSCRLWTSSVMVQVSVVFIHVHSWPCFSAPVVIFLACLFLPLRGCLLFSCQSPDVLPLRFRYYFEGRFLYCPPS